MTSDKAKMIRSLIDDCEQEGLYLIFKDESCLALTKENIEQTTESFWEDPSNIPSDMKTAIEFQRCGFCPLRKTGGICDAIRPTLPFLEHVDKYVSHDEVTAIYKESKESPLHILDCTMQAALKYVSVLSLTHYCQVAKKYRKYFWGILPFMNAQDIVARLYLNIFYLHNGQKRAIADFVSEFKEVMTITSKNQVQRMNLVCKRDAFMNAFANTQVITQFLSLGIDESLQETFNSFGETVYLKEKLALSN
ncbi:MAG: hypothetical protein KAS75_00580 [Planctomycetes bacterium]|nr:hypothetical protein [Planctomycetota bacterium]